MSIKFQENKKMLYTVPVIILLGLFPFLVGRIEIPTYTEQVPWMGGVENVQDFFLVVKQIVLYFVSIIMLIIMVGERKNYGLTWKKNPLFLLLIMYGVFVLGSSIFCKEPEYRWLSFRGMAGNMQGAFVVLCYLVVFFYGVWWGQNIRNMRPIVITWIVQWLLFGVLGVCQLIGTDPLSVGPLAALVGGKEARVTHMVYLTLYHWNYVGSYLALMIPLMVALGIHYYRKREKKYWILCLICFYMSVISLCGSQSRTGMIGLGVTAILFSISYRKMVRRHWMKLSVFALTVAGIFLGCNQYITGRWFGRWNEIQYETNVTKKLSYIITGENRVEISFKGKPLYMTIQGEGENINLELKKADDSFYIMREDEKGIYCDEEPFQALRFRKISIEMDKKIIYGFQLMYKNSSWRITNQFEKKGYYYQNPWGQFDKMIYADTAFPYWVNGFASLRGFVWSRTIPLLPDYLVWGAGQDQFAFAFPHQDYVARYKYKLLDTYYQKPHNWYLQMAIESGVISAICVVVFWICYLRRNRKSRGTAQDIGNTLIRAVFFSMMAYLITAIFNDSLMVVAAPMWCLAGALFPPFQDA